MDDSTAAIALAGFDSRSLIASAVGVVRVASSVAANHVRGGRCVGAPDGFAGQRI
jgi:hypothetical protein